MRLPRQAGGGASIAKEARWLPFVGARVSAAVPEVIGIGEPSFGYSERWAITRWLDGVIPVVPLAGSATGASVGLSLDLAQFVRGNSRCRDAR